MPTCPRAPFLWFVLLDGGSQGLIWHQHSVAQNHPRPVRQKLAEDIAYHERRSAIVGGSGSV
jgi:hypothetical protein